MCEEGTGLWAGRRARLTVQCGGYHKYVTALPENPGSLAAEVQPASLTQSHGTGDISLSPSPPQVAVPPPFTQQVELSTAHGHLHSGGQGSGPRPRPHRPAPVPSWDPGVEFPQN